MGSCFSKKKCSKEAFSSPPPCPEKPSNQIEITRAEGKEMAKPKNSVADGEEGKKAEERGKKEVFVIKHQRSHAGSDSAGTAPVSPTSAAGEVGTDGKVGHADAASMAAVRTSSCTREELDAILIQCGRLSRSSSGKATESAGFYSGSSRRYSGSKRSYDFDNSENLGGVSDNKDDEGGGGENRQYRRQRDHRRSKSSPHGRRRTPSREAEQRSGSRDRASGSSGRRVSRSPGRRSEGNSSNTGTTNATPSNSSAVEKSRPAKMVSVPASVSTLPTDQINNGGAEVNGNAAIRRVLVRRNRGTSPRSQSPANPSESNANCNQQQPSLSRSSSRKKEQSPYRRNPLTEIDNNVQNRTTRDHIAMELKPSFEMNPNKGYKEGGGASDSNTDVKAEISQPRALTRSRSSTRSRDFDYNALLLEDIQNFHQKRTPVANEEPAATKFSLPACLSKANSILEAVADLNSADNSSNNGSEKRRFEPAKDPIPEPNFPKYVTVKRGSANREEMDDDEQESSGSNSFVTQQNWVSSSSSLWEPSSADSADRFGSSSRSREEASEMNRRRLVGGSKKTDLNPHLRRKDDKLGGGRAGNAGRGVGRVPAAAAAASI